MKIFLCLLGIPIRLLLAIGAVIMLSIAYAIDPSEYSPFKWKAGLWYIITGE